MKATVGVYTTHDEAIAAVQRLKDAGVPVKNISIIGRTVTEKVDDEMHVMEKNPIKTGGVATGTTLGVTLGVLTGAGMLAIPGFGFLFGAGALAGAIAGFDMGLIGGGIVSVLMSLGFNPDVSEKYKDALEAGKYLVVVQGDEEAAVIANAEFAVTTEGAKEIAQQ